MEGFDPDAFDPDALDRQLAALEPRRPTATAASASAEATLGRQHCSCGKFQDDDLDMEFVPVRPVSLAPSTDLAAAARQVPLIDSALRPAHWCRAGRAVTSRDVLKPALGRRAVQELDLWSQDDELSALQPAERGQRLGRLRSSGDLPCLDNPWRLALYADLVETRAGTARPGAGLPATAGDEGVVELWCESLMDELDALNDLENLGLPPVLLTALDMRSEDGEGLAAAVLRALYEVLEGEWLDTALLLGALRDGLPDQEARLVELLLVQTLEYAAVVQVSPPCVVAGRRREVRPVHPAGPLAADGLTDSAQVAGRRQRGERGADGLLSVAGKGFGKRLDVHRGAVRQAVDVGGDMGLALGQMYEIRPAARGLVGDCAFAVARIGHWVRRLARGGV
ncbi:hypothetical protein [Embleya sp. NPDC059259]|uniref:hypothetical protein n=1 Tax=unclassified Embleya TaxID=2699296 RepID=UPI0036BFBCA9